eukprot:TRINITY_DN15724_c0_g4_i1.p1 TRINITY_DN15724_c0_g4~~TRINITY_DN15724_c0_g4_i1.p1  ORF type:complete len:234 (+),score=14.80 TRINITY_DN15724_c0_g4_i1:73-774(+)
MCIRDSWNLWRNYKSSKAKVSYKHNISLRMAKKSPYNCLPIIASQKTSNKTISNSQSHSKVKALAYGTKRDFTLPPKESFTVTMNSKSMERKMEHWLQAAAIKRILDKKNIIAVDERNEKVIKKKVKRELKSYNGFATVMHNRNRKIPGKRIVLNLVKRSSISCWSKDKWKDLFVTLNVIIVFRVDNEVEGIEESSEKGMLECNRNSYPSQTGQRKLFTSTSPCMSASFVLSI